MVVFLHLFYTSEVEIIEWEYHFPFMSNGEGIFNDAFVFSVFLHLGKEKRRGRKRHLALTFICDTAKLALQHLKHIGYSLFEC